MSKTMKISQSAEFQYFYRKINYFNLGGNNGLKLVGGFTSKIDALISSTNIFQLFLIAVLNLLLVKKKTSSSGAPAFRKFNFDGVLVKLWNCCFKLCRRYLPRTKKIKRGIFVVDQDDIEQNIHFQGAGSCHNCVGDARHRFPRLWRLGVLINLPFLFCC